MKVKIEAMAATDLQLAVDWAAEEGWNPGIYDAENFFIADSRGFFIAKISDEPVGTISAVRYAGGRFGFIGFFIVKREWRGRNVGPELASTALKYLKGCIIGQDGVLLKIKNYEAAGFKLAYKNYRYGTTINITATRCAAVKKIVPADYQELFVYDRLCFPASRELFLHKWLEQPQCRALLYRDGSVQGYGVLRKCRTGYKIGPLFADNKEVAERLFTTLVDGVGEKVWLDVPELNHQAVYLANKHGMVPEFATARMYNGGEPRINIDKIFGVTSFELG